MLEGDAHHAPAAEQVVGLPGGAQQRPSRRSRHPAGLPPALAPETVTAPDTRPAYRPQRVAVPAESRGRFFGAAAGAFVSFAALGLFTSLAPSFLAGTLRETSHAVAGVPAFTAFTAAVVAQIAAGSFDVRRLLWTGMDALAVGIVVVAGTWWPSLGLFLIGGVVAGAGAGCCSRAAS